MNAGPSRRKPLNGYSPEVIALFRREAQKPRLAHGRSHELSTRTGMSRDAVKQAIRRIRAGYSAGYWPILAPLTERERLYASDSRARDQIATGKSRTSKPNAVYAR